MEVTRHAVKRWIERVDPAAAAEVAETAIRDALNQAEWIYQADQDGKLTDFFMLDDIVLVVADGCVVTVFRAEYGFGPEIDQRVCQELKAALAAAREKLDRARDAAKAHAAAVAGEREAIEGERRRLEARLEVLRARENRLLEAQAEHDRQVEELEHEVESYARKLVYSLAYRLEWAANPKVRQMTG